MHSECVLDIFFFFYKHLIWIQLGQCTMYVCICWDLNSTLLYSMISPKVSPQTCMDLEHFSREVSEGKLYLLEGGLKFSIILLHVCEFNKSLFSKWDRNPQPPLDLHITNIQRFLSVWSWLSWNYNILDTQWLLLFMTTRYNIPISTPSETV